MRAHFSLPSISGEENEGRPPINVKFEIPYFTTSGLQVNVFLSYSFMVSFLNYNLKFYRFAI